MNSIKPLLKIYQADPEWKPSEEKIIDGIKMVEIPKQIIEFPNGTKKVHPAFVHNGKEYDSIFVSEPCNINPIKEIIVKVEFR